MNRKNGNTTEAQHLMNARNSNGTFAIGNPGRPKGSRHKATQAALLLLEGEAEALSRKAVELALTGDTTALRLCLERLCPPRKDAPVMIDLPPMQSAKDAVKAVQSVIAAVAQGELTPLEGVSMVGLIDAYRRTLELTDLEERIAELEQALNGTA